MFWRHKETEEKPKKGKTVLLLPINPAPPLDENYLLESLQDRVLEKGQQISVSAFDHQFLVFRINPDSPSIHVTKDTQIVVLENPNEIHDELVDEISGHIEYEFSKILNESDTDKSLKYDMGAVLINSAEAYTRDVGNGVIRLNSYTMEKLNAKEGDVIEIIGNSKTYARCKSIFPSERDADIARLDGLIRRNAGMGLNFPIRLRKSKAVLADKISVIPLEKIPPIDDRYITDSLVNIPVIKGDCILIPYFGGRISFLIHFVEPKDIPVFLTKNTEVQFIEKDLSKLDSLRDYREHLKCYNNILSYDQSNVFALLNKGMIYAAFKKRKEAMELFDKVLSIEPDNQDAKKHRKRLEDDDFSP